MDHPSTISPVDDGVPAQPLLETLRARIATGIAEAPAEFRRVRDDQPYWFAVAIPLAILTVYVYAISWSSWFAGDGTLCCQPFVPLVVAYAIWRDRRHIAATYAEMTEAFVEGSPRKRGLMIAPLLGCLLIFGGAISTLNSLAVLGYVVTLIAMVYYVYGTKMMRILGAPLFYLIFMIPLPLSWLGALTQVFQLISTLAAGQILQLFVHDVHTSGVIVTLPNYTMQVSAPCSGLSILSPVIALTAMLALLKRMHLSWTGIVLIFSAIITFTLNIVRIVVMGLLGGANPALAERLHDTNSLIFAALSFYLTYLIVGLVLRPARRKRTEFEEDLEWAARMQDDPLEHDEADDDEDDDDEEDDE